MREGVAGRSWIRSGIVLMLMMAISACAPNIPKTYGKKVTEEQFQQIRPGHTSRSDILREFGMPLMIAARDEFPALRVSRTAGTGPFGRAVVSRQADPFFELFVDRHQLDARHRIYYYYYTYSFEMDYVFVVYVHSRGSIQYWHTWILVDEDTGMVEDAFFLNESRPGIWAGESAMLPPNIEIEY